MNDVCHRKHNDDEKDEDDKDNNDNDNEDDDEKDEEDDENHEEEDENKTDVHLVWSSDYIEADGEMMSGHSDRGWNAVLGNFLISPGDW